MSSPAKDDRQHITQTDADITGTGVALASSHMRFNIDKKLPECPATTCA